MKGHSRGFVSLVRNSFSFSVDGRLVRPLQSVKSRGLKGNWQWVSWGFQRCLKRKEVSLDSLRITVWSSVENGGETVSLRTCSLLSDLHTGFPKATTPSAAAVRVCKGLFLHRL